MAEEQSQPIGPDLTKGVALDEFVDGKLLGNVGGMEVLLLHNAAGLFAVGAYCTHYHGPLAEGLVVDGSIRCPWHHACFDLTSGEALRAPALSPLACWRVERQNGRVFVREKLEQRRSRRSQAVERMVIIGGGAAGFAAVEMLRRRGFGGSIVMLSSEAAAPVDRPNLSKDYLAGNAPEEWVPLRSASFYSNAGIELRLNTGLFASTPKNGMPSPGMAKLSPMMAFSSPLAESLCARQYQVLAFPMSTPCVRLRTARPSSRRLRKRPAFS